MTGVNSKKGIIAISISAFLIITAMILFLSLSGYWRDNSAGSELVIASDAAPGENNPEIKPEMTANQVEGYYIDDSDGWYYDFSYAPDGKYDGTFSAGYDKLHRAASTNPQNEYKAGGMWTLSNGEIKLYNDAAYQQSMFVCGDYIVDSQNYFVGSVPSHDNFQTVFICKAPESGDTQILNFYSDGKLIMEVIRNDGFLDSAASEALPAHQMFAGVYEIKGDKIKTDIGGAVQEFYILEDGIAKWIYHRRNVD